MNCKKFGSIALCRWSAQNIPVHRIHVADSVPKNMRGKVYMRKMDRLSMCGTFQATELSPVHCFRTDFNGGREKKWIKWKHLLFSHNNSGPLTLFLCVPHRHNRPVAHRFKWQVNILYNIGEAELCLKWRKKIAVEEKNELLQSAIHTSVSVSPYHYGSFCLSFMYFVFWKKGTNAPLPSQHLGFLHAIVWEIRSFYQLLFSPIPSVADGHKPPVMTN